MFVFMCTVWQCDVDVRLQEALQTFAFLLFVVVCVAGAVYLLLVLPETKNKTFMEISQSFAKMNGVSDQTDTEMQDALERSRRLQTDTHTANGIKHTDTEMESSFWRVCTAE